jgi:phage-related holin
MHLIGESFGTVLQQMFGNRIAVSLLVLIALDVVTGLGVAFAKWEFHLAQIGDFMLTKAIPYIIGAGAIQAMVLSLPPEFGSFVGVTSDAAWAFPILAMVGHVLDNIRQMGMPIPEFLGAKPKPEVRTTT